MGKRGRAAGEWDAAALPKVAFDARGQIHRDSSKPSRSLAPTPLF